jgi:rod shape-determining protein MreB
LARGPSSIQNPKSKIQNEDAVFLRRLMGLFSLDMGIDLGTCNTLVAVRGEGIVLNEPSVVAVRKGTNEVLDTPDGKAVGLAAKAMLGRTPGSITAIRPLKDGVIADFEITQAMLSYFIRKVHGNRGIAHPRMVIAVPSGITAVEKRAVLNSAERAGARRVHLVDEPMAAGLGAGLPINEPRGSMIVDVGGGTTEVAVLSLSDIAACTSLRVAGDDMDEAIVNYLRRTYNLMIGPQMAEQIKIQIGSASPLGDELKLEVKGRDMISGLPRRAVVSSEEVREALKEPVGQIIEGVLHTLEQLEPELAADLVDSGVCLAGGGALLRGIDAVLAKACGLDVRVAEDPLTCVARGTAEYLENLDVWGAAMASDEDEYT